MHILKNIVRFFSGGYILLALIGAVFIAPWLNYQFRPNFAPYNPFLFVCALGVGFLLVLAIWKLRGLTFIRRIETKKAFRVITITASVLLLLCELVILHGCNFLTGWDAGTITDFGNYNADYYSIYPNQLFLTGVFATIREIGLLLGFESGYLCCAIVGCAHVAAAVFLISWIAKQLGGYKAGYCCLALAFVFIGLSPWILVPYSDTYGILWTVLILFCYVCVQKRFLKWFGIVVATLIGFAIKPTVIFAFASIVVIELARFVKCKWERRHGRKKFEPCRSEKRTVYQLIPAVLGGALALVLGLGIISEARSINIPVDESRAFSFTHFLMMGFNTETTGSYSYADEVFSESQPVEQRKQANLERWMQRVSEMGPTGVMSLLGKKTLVNYGDGTFAWEQEGNFYKAIFGQNHTLQQFYGIGQKQPNTFASFFQVLWFMVLIGVVAFCFLQKKITNHTFVILLTVLLLSVFLMLFECRARYLFLFSPYYVVIGVLGWQMIAKCAISKRSR